MKNIIRNWWIFLMLLSITGSLNAQDYSNYKGAAAVMLQVKGDSINESKLKNAVITLSNNSQLIVRLNSFPQLEFTLVVHIDIWQIQNYLTSDKVFSTQGSLTVNNITREVKVEYLPLPADDGSVNLSLNIQFNSSDFSLIGQKANSLFIIKLNDATVNRT